MNIEIEGVTIPITLEDIEGFENKYKLELPQDYKYFLLNHNGGMPKIRRFKTKNEKHVSSFKFIMPLTKDAKDENVKHNLEYCYLRFIFMKKMPDNMIPFGEDPREDILCLSIKGDDYGSVYYWDRENELVFKQPASECYHLIAKTFNEFLAGLRLSDDELKLSPVIKKS